jgi:hypothetical protein
MASANTLRLDDVNLVRESYWLSHTPCHTRYSSYCNYTCAWPSHIIRLPGYIFTANKAFGLVQVRDVFNNIVNIDMYIHLRPMLEIKSMGGSTIVRLFANCYIVDELNPHIARYKSLKQPIPYLSSVTAACVYGRNIYYVGHFDGFLYAMLHFHEPLLGELDEQHKQLYIFPMEVSAPISAIAVKSTHIVIATEVRSTKVGVLKKLHQQGTLLDVQWTATLGYNCNAVSIIQSHGSDDSSVIATGLNCATVYNTYTGERLARISDVSTFTSTQTHFYAVQHPNYIVRITGTTMDFLEILRADNLKDTGSAMHVYKNTFYLTESLANAASGSVFVSCYGPRQITDSLSNQ